MHPETAVCLTIAGIDVYVLANNHILDYGRTGLDDTIRTLHAIGIATAGAGDTPAVAVQPAVLEVSADRRILVFSFGTETSGIPAAWAATESRSGADLLPLSERAATPSSSACAT